MTLARGLSIVFVRFDRRKHAGAWETLREHCSRLGQRRQAAVIVDNARPASQAPSEEDGVPVIAGDNGAWEFSAFDSGIAWLRDRGRLFDLTLLVTDAFRAYGDSFLAWTDRHVLDFCRRMPAVAGWIDSFEEPLRLLGSDYDAWLRTSYVVVPSPVLQRIQPLAWPLPDALFSSDWHSPWHADAPLSDALQRALEHWLVPGQGGLSAHPDRPTWHSRFELDEGTFPLFRDKVRAILREHLLSIRLAGAGVPLFDLRLLGDSLQRGAAPRCDGAADLLRGLEAWQSQQRTSQDRSMGASLRLLFAGDVRRPPDAARARALAARVIPLVRQRHPQAVLEVVDDRRDDRGGLEGLAGTRSRRLADALRDPRPVAAVVAATESEARQVRHRWGQAGRSLGHAVAVVGDGAADGSALEAARDVALAEACSLALAAAVERAAAPADDPRSGGFPPSSAMGSSVAVLETVGFRWQAEYQAWRDGRTEEYRRREELERSLVTGPAPFALRALCYRCGCETPMHVDFEYGGDRALQRPNWRERLVCQECGLNSKMRALLHVLDEVVVPGPNPRALIWELEGELAGAAASRFASVSVLADAGGLSSQLGELAGAGSYDCLLVVDMLERSTVLEDEVAASLRLLAPGGGMVFTAAFSTARQRSRGEVAGGGSHGPGRELGWSLLDAFRDAGFEDAAAHFFWSPAFGYLGGEQVVFVARKASATG